MPQPTSKARLVITALFTDQQTPAEVAARYGVHRAWVYKLKARYLAEGDTALEPRSRRPHTSPAALAAEAVDLVVRIRKDLTDAGLDAGPDTIAWHLHHHHGLRVARATISRHLTAAGLVTLEPKKRPKSSYIRFAAEQPNECWQADFTHYRLSTGQDVEILTWLDDHSRYALSVSVHHRITGRAFATRSEVIAPHGMVAASHPLAAQIGLDVLKAGGAYLPLVTRRTFSGGKVNTFHLPMFAGYVFAALAPGSTLPVIADHSAGVWLSAPSAP